MSELKRVGVIGAGTMGHGIAQVSAQAGFEVVLYDVTKAAADAGRAKVEKTLGVGVEKQKVTPEARDAALSKLSTTDTLEALKGCQLVVEAAPEKLALKQELFKQLSALCAPETILATNTSSLSLTEIAAAASNPGRVVGLHFFNPVHLMKLLEVVRAFQTSDETIATVRAYGAAIGKELIVVKDSPGFASSRLGVALGLEATRMLEEGVASAEDIDRAMKLGYGHPMGPLELGDFIGLDTLLSIMNVLHDGLADSKYRPCPLLVKYVEAGWLGRKVGRGFYDYRGETPVPTR
jgi:3-hydroxybutyryl-CoA dehydrogenase